MRRHFSAASARPFRYGFTFVLPPTHSVYSLRLLTPSRRIILVAEYAADAGATPFLDSFAALIAPRLDIFVSRTPLTVFAISVRVCMGESSRARFLDHPAALF